MKSDEFQIRCKKCLSLNCTLDSYAGSVLIKCNQCGNKEDLNEYD